MENGAQNISHSTFNSLDIIEKEYAIDELSENFGWSVGPVDTAYAEREYVIFDDEGEPVGRVRGTSAEIEKFEYTRIIFDSVI